MTRPFKILSGLPPYGNMATPFPAEWGHLGREGLVVEFDTESGAWVANFQPGAYGLNEVLPHPNAHDVVVFAGGDLWVVDPEQRVAEKSLPAIYGRFEVENPKGWILSRQDIALARLGPQGLLWHTRRLSWDGFDEIKISGDELTGLAWTPVDDTWHPFRVNLRTGRSEGGIYSFDDAERLERLAED